MKLRTLLALQSIASNSRSFETVPRPPKLQRDFRLSFRRPEPASDVILVEPAGPLFPEDSWNAQLQMTREQLFGYVTACRSRWQRVIKRNETDGPLIIGTPFLDGWDLSARGEAWGTKIAEELADAGRQLWYEIFEKHGNQDTKVIAQRLQEAASRRELVGVFVADDFYVPWSLLYTDSPAPVEAGIPSVWQGFWGYRHIVQHTTRDHRLDYELKPNAGVVKTSFNYDATLGQACLEPQIAFFKAASAQLAMTKRTEKAQLRFALENGTFDDQIAYFCCHGKASGVEPVNLRSSTLKLDEEFSAEDLDYWARNDLKSNPLVFINACEGGQMTTLFYETVGAVLLKRKATALLGSQLDVPKRFAPEYMRRVLQKICAAEQRRQLGTIVRQVAREFVAVNNPIGLTYSLYRGMDAYIAWNGEG